MNDAAFDTLKFARTLRDKANLSQDAAEGFADAFAGALQGDVARRSDLRELELRLDARIDRLESKFEALEHRMDVKIEALEHRIDVKIEALRSDMLKWVYGAVGFQTLVTLGSVFALARFLAH